MSYANMILYSSVLPTFDDKKEEEAINADDPANKEAVHKELYGN